MNHGRYLVAGGVGFLCMLRWRGTVPGQLTSGGLMMDWTTVVGLVVAVGLVIYLAAALLKPEKFS
jgi:K+-transporting ATPase KdpF subunit